MRSRSLSLAVTPLLYTALSAASGHAAVFYVNGAATGSEHTGASWSAACTKVQDAVNAASPGDEVWVASGTYKGNIQLPPGVGLFGGFSGREANRDARDWVANRTILDGQSRDAVIAVTGPPSDDRTVIDGFTIQNGAGRRVAKHRLGGGIYVGPKADPLIYHNIITGNVVTGEYGRFAGEGAGIGLDEGASADIRNNIIAGNRAEKSGGGIGAPLAVGGVDIVNNTIVRNRAGQGGGIAVADPEVLVMNTIVAYNSSGLYYHAPKPGEAAPPVTNCNISGNSSYAFYGWPQGIEKSGANQADDPQFEGGPAYHLGEHSLCRDAGNPPAPYPGECDVYGHYRYYGDGIDIGAVESPSKEYPRDLPIVYVNASAPDPPIGLDGRPLWKRDGTTWRQALRTIGDAIERVKTPGGEIWVATGSYPGVMLPRGISLYGGFKGGERDKSLRNPAKNPTTLGSTMTAPSTVLSGFEIVGLGRRSRGLWCGDTSPIIDQCTIKRCGWGGVTARWGSPTIRSCTLQGCLPAVSILCGDLTVRNSRFTGNSGEVDAGGVQVVRGRLLATDCLFAGNVGGAVSLTGSTATLTNNTLVGNYGHYRLVTPVGDVVARAGGVEARDSSLAMVNNLVAFNEGGVRYLAQRERTVEFRRNCVYGNAGFDWRVPTLPNPNGRNGNISRDPQFVAWEWGNYHLRMTSPCRDAGDTAVVVRGEVDMDGQTRRLEQSVDIGADEIESIGARETPPAIYHVAANGNDASDGRSWKTAKSTIGGALRAAGERPAEIWVAAGWYTGPFHLPSYTALYGGFAGSELRRSQRNPAKNVTQLMGDTGTKRPVVYIPAGSIGVTVDGFRVTGGWAETSYWFLPGGGLVCEPGSVARITNNVFTGNMQGCGYAVAADHAWIALADNTITENGVSQEQTLGVGANSELLTPYEEPAAGGADGEKDSKDNAGEQNPDGIGRLNGKPTVADVQDVAGGDMSSTNFGSRVQLLNGQVADFADVATPIWGAVTLYQSLGTVEDNVIRQNAGTGLYMMDHCAVRVHHNLVADNTGEAGGIASSWSTGEIANNIITGNHATKNGGGLALDGSEEDVRNNLLARNVAEGNGGGLVVRNSRPLFLSNTITENSAKENGGAAYLYATGRYIDNIFAFNSSGLYADPRCFQKGGPLPDLSTNCVFGNKRYETSVLPRLAGLSGNFGKDPLLLPTPDGSYRLSWKSPCRDAGEDRPSAVSERDVNGDARLFGKHIDVGAVEYHPDPSRPGTQRPNPQ